MRSLVLLAALLMCFSGPGANAQTEAFNTAAITDSTARAAAEQALKKAAAVNEFYCVTESKTPLENGKMVWNKTWFAFRRPNLAFEQLAVQQTPVPGMTGQQQWTTCDGKTIWQYIRNAPGSGEEYVQRLQGKLPPEKIQQMAQKHFMPTAQKFDVARLQGGGIKIGDTISSMVIVEIWERLDPPSITVAGETPEAWVFTAKLMKVSPAGESMRFSVSKVDGLPREIILLGKPTTTITVSGLQPNPQPKVEDRYFHSPIPAAVETLDKTDSLLGAQTTKIP